MNTIPVYITLMDTPYVRVTFCEHGSEKSTFVRAFSNLPDAKAFLKEYFEGELSHYGHVLTSDKGIFLIDKSYGIYDFMRDLNIKYLDARDVEYISQKFRELYDKEHALQFTKDFLNMQTPECQDDSRLFDNVYYDIKKLADFWA